MKPPIKKPGIYDLTEAEYHSDPVFKASLSSSIAKIILTKSPRHAMLAHPKLNPDFEPVHRRTFDLGKAAHAYLLGETSKLKVISADDYKTAAAKKARDEARAADLIPLLAHEMVEVAAMINSLRVQLHHHEDAADAFSLGEAEKTLIWREGDLWCRARLDYLREGALIYDDYKTTSASARPDEFGKRGFFDLGYDVQDAFYRRGIKAVFGIENAHMRFIVQERSPPYAMAAMSLQPEDQERADHKVDEALSWWRWCMEKDKWPGYAKETAWIQAPRWAAIDWAQHEDSRLIAAEAGRDLHALALDWQAP